MREGRSEEEIPSHRAILWHFRRSFTLPEDADRTKVTAEFHDGVLKVHLPTTPIARSKAIEVKVK